MEIDVRTLSAMSSTKLAAAIDRLASMGLPGALVSTLSQKKVRAVLFS